MSEFYDALETRDPEAREAAMLAALTPGLSEGLLRELVVSDGGSTDDTLAIAETLADADGA